MTRPGTEMDDESIKRFIHARLLSHPRFRTVIAISLDHYPTELSATVWVADEPDAEMRQFAYELEAELRLRGIDCAIILKSDRELPFGRNLRLETSRGQYVCRYYRIDPVKDEDFVYVFSVYRGPEVRRFRMSLTRTLASSLRNRNQLEEDRVLSICLETIRHAVETEEAPPADVKETMFGSTDLQRFLGGESEQRRVAG
jgi:hypothetical protein